MMAMRVVDFTNQLRREGQDVHTALVNACPVRMHPIIMTSVATMLWPHWKGLLVKKNRRRIRMNRMFRMLIICTGLLTMILMRSHNAYATLGGTADSVEADRKHFKAVKKNSTNRSNYSVEEMAVGGTKVREYISPDGLVFGVAWSGLRHPDLSVLLGKYADEYQKERTQKTQTRGRKNNSSVKTDNITVEQWGHMRKLQGRAYIQSQLPEGMKPNEIK
jgi:hypothetical protein